ncbi:helix-turn-helix domain-containing protein [Paenibacillus sp. P96]|uniref:Helix-turn-helix domain-containing protein n=1 Tax=Paenibacillus zeirhizosphaerae TaxID=2987519 RepID=A0ABT9FMB5_9BACL|nr:helix-turn-helix domain-containing protein [Paenibacillus sp. P96]MDP4095883.1 helix-turn-helix domain-containing protein [Paenibacillus sp. P96]
MFLKKHTVTRNGKTYCYYRIVAAYKDDAGRRKHRLVKHVGSLTEEEAEQLRQELRSGRHRPKPDMSAAGPPGNRLDATAFIPRAIQLLAYHEPTDKEWNLTEYDMLLFVREGMGELHMAGKKIMLAPGIAVFCPAGTGLYIINDEPRKLLVDRIVFDTLVFAESFPGGGAYEQAAASPLPAGEIRLSYPKRVLHLCKELHAAAQPDRERDSLKVQSIFTQLLDSVFRSSFSREAGGPERWIERSVRYIREHYQDHVTRDQLAAMVGISPEHFSRIFMKETGRSFIDYLNRARIRKGRELLQLTRQSVHDIGVATGFGSGYYFSRKFKQLTGVYPTEYRKRPKNYAALNPHATSCLLAFGIVPKLGVVGEWMKPWMLAYYKRQGDLSSFRETQWYNESVIQKLDELGIDLAIAYSDEEGAERLSDCVPALLLPSECTSWRSELLCLAAAVAREQQAANWLAMFDRKASASRDRLAPLLSRGDTVLIVKIVSGKLYVYGNLTSMGGNVIYDALQLKPPAAVKRDIIDKGLLNIPVAPEALTNYAADHIFLFHYHSNWYAEMSSVLETDQWRQLEQACRKRIYTPDYNVFYGYDPLSMDLQLDKAVELLSSQM